MLKACLTSALSIILASLSSGDQDRVLVPLSGRQVPCFYGATAIVDGVPVLMPVCARHLQPPPAPPIPRHQRRME